MDRRSLIIGGGAAALATTVVAVTGAGISSATSDTTAEHARRVLGLVNSDLGLLNPAALRTRFAEGFAAYRASPPREASGNDLTAWTRQRILDLTGSDSVEDAVTTNPQSRTLLSFGLLAISQRPGVRGPTITRGTQAPGPLVQLEPDFMPVLLGQVRAKGAATPVFAKHLSAGTVELDRIVATESDDTRSATNTSGRDMVNFITGAVVLLFLWYADK